MMHSQKDLICEIDQTIDQLIENAKVIETIAANTCYEHELYALEKTQESLIAHLIHMDEILKKESSFIDSKPLAQAIVENKLSQSCYLQSMLEKKENLEQLIAQKDLTKPKIHKRKGLINKSFKT